jgi:hypothetical protein
MCPKVLPPDIGEAEDGCGRTPSDSLRASRGGCLNPDDARGGHGTPPKAVGASDVRDREWPLPSRDSKLDLVP